MRAEDKVSLLCKFCTLPDCDDTSVKCIYKSGMESYERTFKRNHKAAQSEYYWQHNRFKYGEKETRTTEENSLSVSHADNVHLH